MISIAAENLMHRGQPKRTTLVVIILWILTCARAPHAQTSLSPGSDHEVTVLINAVGPNQNPVEIRAEDLRITEDGGLEQISHFQPIKNSAITLTLIIDISISQERTLDAQKRAATTFVNSIIHSDRDLAAVATLTNFVRVEQQPTDDLELIRAAIDRAKIAFPPGYQRGAVIIGPPPTQRGIASPIGSTAIWDAIVTTCDGSRFSPIEKRRRAIILLTDGQDTASKSKLSEAIESAVRKDITVFSIGIGDPNYDGVNKNALRKLSEDTGGKAYFPKKTTDLSAVFGEIGTLLRNYYEVSYTSIGTKPAGKLKIIITNPNAKGVQLLYPQVVTH
jgi:VWFA-related protein